MLWEVLTRELPFTGYRSHFTLAKAIIDGSRPIVRPSDRAEHGPYVELLEACWVADAECRPTFADIVARLRGADMYDAGSGAGPAAVPGQPQYPSHSASAPASVELRGTHLV